MAVRGMSLRGFSDRDGPIGADDVPSNAKLWSMFNESVAA